MNTTRTKLEAREAAIVAELDRRISPSQRQADQLAGRGDESVSRDEAAKRSLTGSERQAWILSGVLPTSDSVKPLRGDD